MRFFLDENISNYLKQQLLKENHEVESARDIMRGASDKEIAYYARKTKAILITKDIEFGSIVLYPKYSHYGLIVLRLPNNFTSIQLTNALLQFLNSIDLAQLVNKITIIELGRYRTRKI